MSTRSAGCRREQNSISWRRWSGRKGEYAKVFSDLKKEGYVRVRVDGEIRELEEEIRLEKYKQHWIEVVVDRLVARPGNESRLADSVETALRLAKGLVIVARLSGEEQLFSENYACPNCGFSVEEMTPRMFSFNSPYGACPECDGLGTKMEIDPEKVLDLQRSLQEGAVRAWSAYRDSWSLQYLTSVGKHYGLDPATPLREATPEQIDVILYGTQGKKVPIIYRAKDGREWRHEARFEGIVNNLTWRYRQTHSEGMRREIQENYMTFRPCLPAGVLPPPGEPGSYGERENISQLTLFPSRARKFLRKLSPQPERAVDCRTVTEGDRPPLGVPGECGFGIPDFGPGLRDAFRGEAQRIRLAPQVGSLWSVSLYILDEPSIGLHQRDNRRLIETLKGLRDLGITLIVVEHDER